MHHFFVTPDQIVEGRIRIVGPDVHHMRNALRIREGEKVLISDGAGQDYLCRVLRLERDEALTAVESACKESRELPARIWLFQGLPKSDKMEWIIQKAVELGAAGIVPVATKHVVVKLDARKEESRLRRWQAIAEGAAKQSKRSVVPKVLGIMTLKEAFAYTEKEGFHLRVIPYELTEGMESTKKALSQVEPGRKMAVFIGPEGGFDENEIELAMDMGVEPVSLGRRILRTETAGLVALSALMLRLEGGGGDINWTAAGKPAINVKGLGEGLLPWYRMASAV